jgi:hypothetical protein
MPKGSDATLDSPAFKSLRLVVEALVVGPGSILSRLKAAEPHFGVVFDCKMRTRAEEHLRLRIGASLVEGGEEGNDLNVADSIELLDESRAVEIAGDMLRLYELVAGLRTEDGYRLPD